MKKKNRFFNIVTGETYVCYVENNESSDEDKSDSLENIALMGGTTASTYFMYYGIANFDNNRDYKMMGTRQGHGYFAEAVVIENNHGWSKAPLNRKCNEPDLFNEQAHPVQVKCCKTAEDTVEDLFKKGEYKYGEQHLRVPDEQVDEVKQRLEKKGIKSEVNSIAKGMSYEKIKKCTVRGKESCIYDAKIALQNPAFKFFVGGVFISSYTYFSFKEKSKAKKRGIKPSHLKPLLNAFGTTLGGIMVYTGGAVLKGQLKRK